MRKLPAKPLLEVAPWIGAGLAEEERRVAARHLIVSRLEFPPGEWTWPAEPEIGLLILRGRIARNLTIGDVPARGVEVLGEGELLRPWTFRGEAGSVPSHADWLVLATMEVAALDGNFRNAIARWPELAMALIDLTIERTRTLCFFLTARQVTKLEGRILLTLWHLADRWGKVTPSGVVIDLPKLTHEMIARMVAARRPSVTSAIRKLRELGVVEARPGGTWVLHGDPVESLRKVAVHVGEADGALTTPAGPP